MPENLEGADGVCYSQPRTLEDRRLIAKDFSERFTYGVPLTVDLMDNALMKAYAAWPERLYVIEGGKVVLKGAPGPKGFDPEVAQAWLEAYVAR